MVKSYKAIQTATFFPVNMDLNYDLLYLLDRNTYQFFLILIIYHRL